MESEWGISALYPGDNPIKTKSKINHTKPFYMGCFACKTTNDFVSSALEDSITFN